MSFDLPQELAQQFSTDRWSAFPTLVAVSGGPDSVALLRAIHSLANRHESKNLIVAHVDHGTRDGQSAKDAQWVKQLAQHLQLDCHVVTLQPNDPQPKPDSDPATPATSLVSEENFRRLRFDALVAVAGQTGARYLLMGHHLNDQVETVLFRMCRGTGLVGAAGIPKFRVISDALTVVRPMLNVRREQLIGYLESLGQDYLVDATNHSNVYTRNFLRHEILPALDTKFGDVTGALERFRCQAAETNQLIDDLLPPLFAAVEHRRTNLVRLQRQPLSSAPLVLVKSFYRQLWNQQAWPLQSMTAKWWQRLADATIDGSFSQVQFNLPDRISATFQSDSIQLQKSE